MWQGTRRGHKSQPQCTMELEHIQRADDELVSSRRCQPQTPPHSRQPYLHFPPPPKHPPPNQSHSHTLSLSSHSHNHHHHHHHHSHSHNHRMSEDHLLSLPGPSTDYSYAYYEPGPPTRHHNVPHRYLGGAGTSRSYREGSYRSKHTYLTRYGTEENIYEEISDVARARMRPVHHQESMMSLNQSLVEEEVRRVQHGHRRVLGELNLSVEAMLMPSNSREGSDDTETEVDDQLADLLTVGPTDELLSPVPQVDLDSGFSGSSSGASYRSAAGSLRRGPDKVKASTTQQTPKTSTATEPAQSKSFWSRKGWKKLGFSSSSLNKNKEKGILVSLLCIPIGTE